MSQVDLFAFNAGDRVRYIPPKQCSTHPACEDGTVKRAGAVIFVQFDGKDRVEATGIETLVKI